jgi:hypothetical protein
VWPALASLAAGPPAWAVRADVPVVPGRDAALEAARRELLDPAYRAHEPSLWQRIASWVLKHLKQAFDSTAGSAPGGWWAVVALVAVVGAVVLGVRARLGPMAAAHRRDAEVFSGSVRAAADHHRAADAALAAGDLAGAVQERFRALVRGLEERGLLEARPGYTADEAASEAGRLLPSCADALRAAARVFDDVRYGGRAATAHGHQQVAAAVAAVRAARPAALPADAPAGPA